MLSLCLKLLSHCSLSLPLVFFSLVNESKSKLRFCALIIHVWLYRSSNAMKPFENDGTDLENGELEKDKDKATRSNMATKVYNQALLSGLAYCVSSCSMILVNKFVLSSYNFNAGIFLMLYQVIFCNWYCLQKDSMLLLFSSGAQSISFLILVNIIWWYSFWKLTSS